MKRPLKHDEIIEVRKDTPTGDLWLEASVVAFDTFRIHVQYEAGMEEMINRRTPRSWRHKPELREVK